jgi:uncharacterized protein (DUF3084 family)
MDQKQVEKRLKWFDEQRIKDSELLQALIDRNKYLEESIEKLDRKFLTLSDETSRTAARQIKKGFPKDSTTFERSYYG